MYFRGCTVCEETTGKVTTDSTDGQSGIGRLDLRRFRVHLDVGSDMSLSDTSSVTLGIVHAYLMSSGRGRVGDHTHVTSGSRWEL